VVFKGLGIIDLNYYLALFHWKSAYFQPWQFVTHLFMHGGWAHLFFNMFALWMFGNAIENVMGAKKFLIFYFVCGFGAALCHLAVFSYVNIFEQMPLAQQQELMFDPNFKLNIPTVGASGAIFGLLFAFGYLFPNLMIYVYFLFPLKAKYFVAIYAALELFAGFQNRAGDNVAHFAHLGGMLFAFLLLRYWHLSGKNSFRY
jgi:membrane associated rhomboid family serine protease